MATNPILNAGTLVGRNVASTTLFLDDGASPALNVAHQWLAGTVNLSAGPNPSQGFSVSPLVNGNTQILSGPNILVSNTLSAPGTISLGTANIANALTVTGPTTLTGNLSATGPVSLIGNTNITGSLTASGSANVVNSLSVGNTVYTPTLIANSMSAVGNAANVYIETRSALSSNNAALYLSATWRLKVVTSGSNYLLAMQTLVNGSWVNSQVFAPPNVSLSVGSILNAIV